ncbi:hypothetical protein GCM10010172_56840 [Paractinoplanes ferrugineus]|uniref:Uncharacterized protein n=1 Tax=Paractinoplanes ferrugineus TaxID=113564 RepID=A0A919M8U5_9ACTN|nr:hypothetical protein [Actinoplanes ferrugineus]GIE10846.1 hypothetical protein Afe05nite_26860 [Actinoplanes ferrugineus]
MSFSSRERWVMLVASAWLVTGLQLDAYAHATTPQLETFWTPWHAVLYSGIAASGLTLVWLLRSRLPSIPTYQSLNALPNALRVPLLGMAFLLVGGGIDTLWHNVFGIEQGLEIFVSPSHEFIILGMVLVAAGPALMSARSTGDRLSFADGAIVTVSALLTSLPLHIYSLHANVLGEFFFGDGADPVRIYSTDAQVMHGFLFTTVLLLLPIVLIGRRWRLPIGVPALLVTVPALAMHLMFLEGDPWWMSLTVAIAAACTEAVARVAGPFLPLSAAASWVLLGLLAPAVVWGALLLAAANQDGVGWNVHVVSGLLTYTALTGAGTVLVARNIRPAAPARAADEAAAVSVK